MTPTKRIMDVVCALALAIPLAPVMVVLAVVILVTSGRPVFYVAERMKTPDQGFGLWKFRTMTTVTTDAGVSGGDKTNRITPVGGFLRRYRLDEIPQLWNILRGDISFVGPRPPLRRYVEMFPDIYSEVLKSRPGVTGLATLVFHKTEERILAKSTTTEETEQLYCRRCIPAKAQLDLIYATHQSLCFDLKLMFATVIRRVSIRSGGR